MVAPKPDDRRRSPTAPSCRAAAATGLQAPTVGQGPGVDPGEPDLVDQLDDRPHGILVVAGDRDRQSLRGGQLRVVSSSSR
jgi:hypothetical protein